LISSFRGKLSTVAVTRWLELFHSFIPSSIMFLPGRSVEDEKKKLQLAYKKIEEYCLQLMPEDPPAIRDECTISAQEVQCGDPQCAPIDTMITLLFKSGGQGFFGLPMEAKDVTLEHLQEAFPPPDIIEKWYRGEDADWPPEPEPIPLRFREGHKVLCRVGPTEWAPGVVTQLWYRESNWQPGMFAPYKIHLDDGRDIFAPQDMDQIIRLNPNEKQTVPLDSEAAEDAEAE
jgi:hypothetical protein